MFNTIAMPNDQQNEAQWVGKSRWCPKRNRLPDVVIVLAVLLVVAALPEIARGQSAIDGFDPGANGSVFAVAVQADGKILLGGSFTMLGGGGTGTTTRNRIARLNPDGSLDTSFDPGANSTVTAIAVQSDGKIVVGGNFTMLGGGGTGTAALNKIGRLNQNGGLDPSFDPGLGADSAVKAIAVQADGKILVGGFFLTLGGQTRHKIARLSAVGSLDTTSD